MLIYNFFFFFLNLGAKNHKNKFGVAQGGVKKWFGVGEKKEKKESLVWRCGGPWPGRRRSSGGWSS